MMAIRTADKMEVKEGVVISTPDGCEMLEVHNVYSDSINGKELFIEENGDYSYGVERNLTRQEVSHWFFY